MFHFNCIITKKVIKISILNPTSTRKRSNIHQISNILCLVSKTRHILGQMDRSTSLAALTRLHLRKRGHWRRLNIMCNKERREEVWAARPATLAFVPAPATAAPLTPPPGWSISPCISPRFLQSPHSRGVVEAVSCRRGHRVVVTTYCRFCYGSK